MEAEEAKTLDEWLMSPLGGAYRLEQLMELAGLSVAQVISHYYPTCRRILIICGPGNNGGDGMVAGRNLLSFGAVERVHIWCPVSKGDYQKQLLQQAKNMGALIIDGDAELSEYDLIVDAIFGKA